MYRLWNFTIQCSVLFPRHRKPSSESIKIEKIPPSHPLHLQYFIIGQTTTIFIEHCSENQSTSKVHYHRVCRLSVSHAMWPVKYCVFLNARIIINVQLNSEIVIDRIWRGVACYVRRMILAIISHHHWPLPYSHISHLSVGLKYIKIIKPKLMLQIFLFRSWNDTINQHTAHYKPHAECETATTHLCRTINKIHDADWRPTMLLHP